jgi:hypothetical protein
MHVDLDGFWAIVESARARCGGDWTEVSDLVVESLAALPLGDIADFAQIHDGLEWQAYREDLWAACVLINGGFGSDDTFLYFRDWLLVQGRAVWEAALADPDSLAEVPTARAITATGDDFADCEEFLYVASQAWERLTGDEDGLEDELDERGFTPHRDEPVETAGERIDFDDRARMYAVLPKLSALFYDRAAAGRRMMGRQT